MHLPGVSRLNAATSASSRSLALVLAAWSLCASWATGAEPENLDWPAYLGGKERNLYSPLKQIHRGNVTQLEVAWTYETGDNGEYQANNLIVDGTLYTASPARRVIALDAATGRERWKWDPAKERSGKGAARQRGLVYWKSETGEASSSPPAAENPGVPQAAASSPSRRRGSRSRWQSSDGEGSLL